MLHTYHIPIYWRPCARREPVVPFYYFTPVTVDKWARFTCVLERVYLYTHNMTVAVLGSRPCVFGAVGLRQYFSLTHSLQQTNKSRHHKTIYAHTLTSSIKSELVIACVAATAAACVFATHITQRTQHKHTEHVRL